MRADPQALGSALIFRSADGVVFEVLGDGDSDELGFGAGFARVDAALHFGAEAVGEADGHWGGVPVESPLRSLVGRPMRSTSGLAAISRTSSADFRRDLANGLL